MEQGTAPAGKEAQVKEPRLVATEEGVTIGKRLFRKSMLQSWGAWQGVESALKRFDSAPTAEEWKALEEVAATAGARNGLTEVKEALARVGWPNR
jgi:hypothetical protein